ncbi:hypothetical protein P7C70_g3069, partial [Phenoliferia sp. Uapishka_3]
MATADDIYDVLGIGFGPSGLALAIATAESNNSLLALSPRPARTPTTFSSLGGLQAATGYKSSLNEPDREDRATEIEELDEGSELKRRTLKVCFVERFEEFKWHPGMMIPGSKMQISFLKDLATLRDPTSSYTFLSYLHSLSPSRLLSFISLSTFSPSRREFSDYMSWAANKVEIDLKKSGGSICYGEQVLAVSHVEPDGADGGESAVRLLRVRSREVKSGKITERLTRNLVVSTGGIPFMPPEVEEEGLRNTGRVLHSSEYLAKIDRVLDEVMRDCKGERELRLAVVGGGQSATEIFVDLRKKLGERWGGKRWKMRPSIDLYIRRMALKATEESQFANEVFDPSMSQGVYGLSPSSRETILTDSRSTNYSVVNPRTLSALYEAMYDQKVEEDIAARDGLLDSLISDPKLSIHPYSELSSAYPLEKGEGINLSITNTLTS